MLCSGLLLLTAMAPAAAGRAVPLSPRTRAPLAWRGPPGASTPPSTHGPDDPADGAGRSTAPTDLPLDPATPRTAAEALFSEGEAAYEAGDFGTAADRFARAQALAPHPATLYNLGMAQHQAGEALRAYDTFAELQRIAGTPDERAEAVAAQQRVRRELSAVIAVVAEGVTVCLDDKELPPATTGNREQRERLTTPGPHALAAFGRRAELDLLPGETQILWLDGWGEAAAVRPRRRRQWATALIAIAAASGTAAVVTGMGAGLADNRVAATRWGWGAAVSGLAALGSAGGAVFVLHHKRRKRPPSRARSTACAQPD